jgi:hypothetical protein
MIAQLSKATATAKPLGITIGLDERGAIQQVDISFEVEYGMHRFGEGVTWHDGQGVSATRADDHWRRLLEMLVEKIVADTRRVVEK